MDSARFDFQKKTSNVLFREQRMLDPLVRFGVPVVLMLLVIWSLPATLRNANSFAGVLLAIPLVAMAGYLLFISAFFLVCYQVITVTPQFVTIQRYPIDRNPDRILVSRLDEVETRPATWKDYLVFQVFRRSEKVSKSRTRYMGGSHVAFLVMGCDWRLAVGTDQPEGFHRAVEEARRASGASAKMVE